MKFSLPIHPEASNGSAKTWQVAIGMVVLVVGLSQAQFPIQNMGTNRLAFGYTLETSGQNITEQNTPSQQSSHLLNFAYAPIPYAGLSLAMGISKFETEPNLSARAFEGKFGFSPSIGIHLATPSLIQDFFRVAANATAQYFSSEDKNRLAYSGYLVKPDLGIVLSPYNFLDIQLGGRMHLIQGNMEPSSAAAPTPFSNGNLLRGYFGATLKTPTEGAFLSIDLDMSPEADANWSHGPVESTLRITMGTVIGWKSREPKAAPRNPYFPNYRELKERQDAMSDELQSDP